MKTLINLIREDFKKEGFKTRDIILVGIGLPVALIALCIIANTILK